MPYVNDPGGWSQVQDELGIKQAQLEHDQYSCCCPRCNRFGIVCGKDEHYGTIYRCNCLLLLWAIDPETDKKVSDNQRSTC